MGRKFIDLTGQKFGKLTVIKRVENDKHGQVMWLCECDCGCNSVVMGYNLKREHTKSCGKCSNNTWEFKDDCVIGYTTKGKEFYIDVEDYDRVKNYTWYRDSEGNDQTLVDIDARW